MGDGAIAEPIVLARVGTLRVGSIFIEPADCIVRNEAGQQEALEPRVMQVLVVLVRAEGAPVSRDELIASCWGGRVVSNDAITRVISILRKLARDIGGDSFEVETLNKVGYRLRETPGSANLPQTAQPEQAAFSPIRRGLLALGAGGLALLGAGWWIWKPNAAERTVSRTMTLAVNSFTADATDRELTRIADGTSNAIRLDLGRVAGIRIVNHGADGAALRSDRSKTDTHIAPNMTLAASLERREDDLHLIMTLTDARSGEQLWSAAIDGPRTNPSDLARDAAGAVIEQLVLLMPAAAWPIATEGLRSDPEAYRLSTEARALCDDLRERLLAGKPDEAQQLGDQAAGLVARALAINPEYPDALVVLARLTRNGWSQALAAQQLTTQQRVDQARALLRRALRSDPRNAGAMTGLADIYRRFGWRWDNADILFRHAFANDPLNADAHWSYSHQLVTLGRARDGLDQVSALLAIDHAHLWRRITLPRMLYCFGARDLALAAYYRELAALPGNPFLLWEIYYLFVAEGSIAGLSDFIERLEQTRSNGTTPASVQAIIARSRAAIEAMSGRPAALLVILDAERASLDTKTLTHATLGGRARDDLGFILAMEYARAAQYDRAVALLDQALAAMSVYWVPSLPFGSAPFPAAMQRDPRFQALWQRDPRLAEATQRRRHAASIGQMATARADGTIVQPKIDHALGERIDAMLRLLPSAAHEETPSRPASQKALAAVLF